VRDMSDRQRMTVIICSYVVDKDDVSEAQMAYEWISRISEHANLVVVTTGSRRGTCTGLESLPGVTLEILAPRFSFRRWDAFDRFAHPGYIEYFWRARARIRRIVARQTVHLGHHLTPNSVRYPSPLAFVDVPFVCGPYYGGLAAPAVMSELEGKEQAFYYLRKLDHIRMRFDPWVRRHFTNTQRIMVSAPYMLDALRDYENKCVVIPGTALEPAATERPSVPTHSTVRMMYVGKLEPSKGVELMVLALGRLAFQEWVLDIYGHGSHAHLYKQLAEQLGISSRIRWHGFVPNAQIRAALNFADIFVFPSLKEPAGIAPLEAMAAGLPMVVVDAGGPAYAVTSECGIKVALGNKEAMINSLGGALQRLATDPVLRVQMGDAARQRLATEFGWPSVLSKLLRLYNEVAESRS
jgi:glycosyltransferase involved in cell wall biosynthesis